MMENVHIGLLFIYINYLFRVISYDHNISFSILLINHFFRVCALLIVTELIFIIFIIISIENSTDYINDKVICSLLIIIAIYFFFYC